MTSFTSDNLWGRIVSASGPDPLRSSLVYVIATLFCAFFGAVYEVFSHEVYSYFMIYAFALPLALGALPNLVIALKGLRAPGKTAANLWNSGVATLTVGCIFQGALEIYGTTSQLVIVYPVVAVVLLVAGGAIHACGDALARRAEQAAAQRVEMVDQAEWAAARQAEQVEQAAVEQVEWTAAQQAEQVERGAAQQTEQAAAQQAGWTAAQQSGRAAIQGCEWAAKQQDGQTAAKRAQAPQAPLSVGSATARPAASFSPAGYWGEAGAL